MNHKSKYATKLPDSTTQRCLQWARTAGSFCTLEMALDLLDCSTLGDKAHRKAGRVMANFRHLFCEMARSQAGSIWKMLAPEYMPEGVLFPLSEFQEGVHVGAGWGFRRNGMTYSFATIQNARLALIRNA